MKMGIKELCIRILLNSINTIDYYVRKYIGATALRVDSDKARLDLETLVEHRGRDYDFIEPCCILMEGLSKDRQLTLFGRYVANELLGGAKTIETFLAYVDNNPEINEVEIKNPIFIVGQMRTGTTFLFNLLAQDDSLFAPPVWQMLNPTPLNNNACEKEARVGHALQNIDLLNTCFPDIKKTHPLDALGPEECEVQFLRCFVSRDLPLMAHKKLLSYMTWYQTIDDETLARLYRHYDLEIKAFVYQMGKVQKRVLRKDSNHMSFIRQLMATYPDAKIVHTVRDPASFVPSSCSVNETYAEQYYFKSDIEPLVISHRVLKHMKHEAECFTSFRKSYDVTNQGKGACAFLDINFRDLVKSPMATVRSIYAHIGKELSPKAEFAMRQYIKDNPQHKHGVHSYSLEKYGLEADLLRNEFKEYIQYFNVKYDK